VVYYYLDRLRQHFSKETPAPVAQPGPRSPAAPAAARELTLGDG
jgi:hypothetical protein